MPLYSRRTLLSTSAVGGLIAATGQATAAPYDKAQAPAGTYVGPRDPRQEALNPSELTPIPTDHGNLGTLMYSFSEAHNRHTDAGWAREVTVRNFPMSKAMAGVDMRLPKGAVRELHWHLPAEWAYVTYGHGRITAVDPSARKFVADVKEGDLWFFPSGIPHSIQGLGPDGCEFVLVFNDGNFSEDSTFLITDWINHTPPEILAKNLNVPLGTFDHAPKKDLWIFNAPMPGSLDDDLAQSSQAEVQNSYKFSLMDQTPIKTKSGTVRIADANNFKASTNMAAALVEIEPGGLRELHWHPTSDEWQYYISGTARMTVFAGEGRANTVDFAASDVGYVPRSLGHYVENTGKDVLRFLEVFTTGQYADISLTSWMANTPNELVAAHLNIDEAVVRALPRTKTPIVPA
jgi:oxalate decarboxylase